MQEAISLWPLIGIAVIVVGFVLRFNPVLVVIISGIVTGVAAHMPIATILEKLGEGFLNTRNLPFILLLPRQMGVAGIYLAQPAADLLTIAVCLLSVRPMKRIASEHMAAA